MIHGIIGNWNRKADYQRVKLIGLSITGYQEQGYFKSISGFHKARVLYFNSSILYMV